jgi:hypothetical protein
MSFSPEPGNVAGRGGLTVDRLRSLTRSTHGMFFFFFFLETRPGVLTAGWEAAAALPCVPASSKTRTRGRETGQARHARAQDDGAVETGDSARIRMLKQEHCGTHGISVVSHICIASSTLGFRLTARRCVAFRSRNKTRARIG